jgi:hypothetical protein
MVRMSVPAIAEASLAWTEALEVSGQRLRELALLSARKSFGFVSSLEKGVRSCEVAAGNEPSQAIGYHKQEQDFHREPSFS